jgi:hypothetical protein
MAMHTPFPNQTQLERVNRLLGEVWTANPSTRASGARPDCRRPAFILGRSASYPLTTRAELLADQTVAPPLGTNLTSPFADLKRFHRSSGTTHAPILWADSVES